MESEDESVVVPDPVASQIRGCTRAFEDADYAEFLFLRSWTDADREVFKAYVEAQVELHKGFSLGELNGKVERNLSLVLPHYDRDACVKDGALSNAAKKHGMLKALRKCHVMKELEKTQLPCHAWRQSLGHEGGDATPALLRLQSSARAMEVAAAAPPALQLGARARAFQDADYAEFLFLRSWTEADRELFKAYTEDQVELYKGFSLDALNLNVKNLTVLCAAMYDEAYVIEGKLSIGAQLHGMVKAMRKWQGDKELEKIQAHSTAWLQSARVLQLMTDKEGGNAKPALGGNAKQAPASGGFQPPRLKASFRDSLKPSRGGPPFTTAGGGIPPVPSSPAFDHVCFVGGARGGAGGRAAAPATFGAVRGGSSAGAGLANGAAAPPSQPHAMRQPKEKHCDGCSEAFPASDVNWSLSLMLNVCSVCERKLLQAGPAMQGKTAFHRALEKAQRAAPAEPRADAKRRRSAPAPDDVIDVDGDDEQPPGVAVKVEEEGPPGFPPGFIAPRPGRAQDDPAPLHGDFFHLVPQLPVPGAASVPPRSPPPAPAHAAPPPDAAVVPPDVAALLTRVSLPSHGAALVGLGVASCADLALLTDADLKDALPALKLVERRRLLAAAAPAPAAPAAPPVAAPALDPASCLGDIEGAVKDACALLGSSFDSRWKRKFDAVRQWKAL